MSGFILSLIYLCAKIKYLPHRKSACHLVVVIIILYMLLLFLLFFLLVLLLLLLIVVNIIVVVNVSVSLLLLFIVVNSLLTEACSEAAQVAQTFVLNASTAYTILCCILLIAITGCRCLFTLLPGCLVWG